MSTVFFWFSPGRTAGCCRIYNLILRFKVSTIISFSGWFCLLFCREKLLPELCRTEFSVRKIPYDTVTLPPLLFTQNLPLQKCLPVHVIWHRPASTLTAARYPAPPSPVGCAAAPDPLPALYSEASHPGSSCPGSAPAEAPPPPRQAA